MRFDIDFPWSHDEAGYRLLPASPGYTSDAVYEVRVSISKPGRIVGGKMVPAPGSPPPIRGFPAMIVPSGGKLVRCYPFANTGGRLFRIFTALGRTEQGLLDFYRQYGPLTARGNTQDGDDPRLGLWEASRMNDLLTNTPENRAAHLMQFGDEGMTRSHLEVSLVCDPISGKPKLRFRPWNLLEALWLELGECLSGDATIRPCVYCGALFEAGPGTGRRGDAEFCTDAHRIKFNSLRRSKGGIEDA